jgi:hypothetical protein
MTYSPPCKRVLLSDVSTSSRHVATMLILLGVLAVSACESATLPGYYESPQVQYVDAQSTLDYGEKQMRELSHQATMVGLDLSQAANAAEQTTLDYNQRQMMELAFQATAVSLNMAQAAAAQKFLAEQTQMAWNTTATTQSLVATTTAQSQAATASAQSQAATATNFASILNITQTAQAKAIFDVQATYTAQANATQAAYSLTATPWAVIQADILRTRKEAERRAWWGEFVVTPLKLILITLVVLLLIVGGVIAYMRLMPVLELRLRTFSHYNDSPMLLVDGMIVDPDPPYRQITQREVALLKQPQVSNDETPLVEIISPSDPSVARWVTEAEQGLLNQNQRGNDL